MRNDIWPLFSKTMYVTDVILNQDEESKLNKIYDNIEFNKARRNAEHNKSCEISKELRLFQCHPLTFLEEKIMERFHNFSKNIMHYDNNFIITNSWFTKTHKGQESMLHAHKNHMYSMVYYWGNEETEDNKIEFKNYNSATSFNLSTKEKNIYNSDEYGFKVNNGMLIVFPTEVHHMILENKNNSIRKSMAMNLLPTGTIGTGDSAVELR